MNQKVQLEKLKQNIEWLLYQTIMTKQSSLAVISISTISQTTDALSLYGDFFAYSQNIMIGEVQLQLAKLFIDNKDSYSLSKIILEANELFTQEYHQMTGYNLDKSYDELKDKLVQLETDLSKLSVPVSNLKKLRDKNLAHLDKKITNPNDLENWIQSNPIYLSDIQKLIDFAVKSLSIIKSIMFNIYPTIKPREYTFELEQIAEAIKEHHTKKLNEMISMVGETNDN